MFGFVLIAAAAAFGVGAVRRLGWPLGRVEAIALAAAFALTAGPWCLFLAVWALGWELGLVAGAVALAALAAMLGRGRRIARADGPAPSRLSWLVLAVVFALLFHSHMLHAEPSGLWSGGSTYGDLALHASLASSFTHGGELSFASPITAGEPLTYPFLGDFTVACLMRGGWSMSTAFAVTGWLCAMTGLALFEALARRMFGSRAAGTIAVWLIVCSGALIGLYWLAVDTAAKGLPHDAGQMPTYANMSDRGVSWSNLVCDFLLPQRALLAAFPAVWAACLMLRIALDEAAADPRARVRLLGAAALAIGALPLLHVHSFLLTFGFLLLAACWRSAVADGRRRIWWLALALAAAAAAPQLVWQLGHSWGADFGRWHRGWRAPAGEFWLYWLKNWGLPFALVPVAALVAVRLARGGRGSFAVLLVAGAVATFAAGNVYLFQPNDWDNMKFFAYAHMAIALVLAGALARWGAAGGLRRAAAALAIVAMTGTGAQALVRELAKHDQLASQSDLRLAARLREVLPEDARVLTCDAHNHLVSMLAGRRIVMGYRGWLWTHGIDVRPLERDVRAMFRGGDDAPRLFRRRGVTHVYIGPGETHGWGADPAWFRARYPAVLAQDGVEVFDVRATAAARSDRISSLWRRP